MPKKSNEFHDSLTLLNIVPILLLTNKKKIKNFGTEFFEEKRNILELIFKAHKAHKTLKQKCLTLASVWRKLEFQEEII